MRVRSVAELIAPPHVRVALPPREEVSSEVVRHVVHIRRIPAYFLMTALVVSEKTVF